MSAFEDIGIVGSAVPQLWASDESKGKAMDFLGLLLTRLGIAVD